MAPAYTRHIVKVKTKGRAMSSCQTFTKVTHIYNEEL